MAAIAGIVDTGRNAPSRADVQAMLDAMPHRCRDGIGIAAAPGAVFGHGRFFTTSEAAAEVQPESFGPWLTTADARIDNRADLAATLGVADVGTVGDAEFITKAVARWGSNAADRLHGDFAWAAWNAEAKELLLARDFLGHRPLYYAVHGSKVAFSSELQGVLQLPWVDRTVDKDALIDWRIENPECTSSSIVRAVRRVPPACVARIVGGRVEIRRYWEPKNIRVDRGMTLAQAVDGARKQFDAAVAARLRTQLPVACTLSGGLDSSSVAVTIRHLRPQRKLPAFSLDFAGYPLADEREFQQAVVDQGGYEWIRVPAEPNHPWHDIPAMVDAAGGPYTNVHGTFLAGLLREAGRTGPTVLLDGSEGDNAVWHGHFFGVNLLLSGRWFQFARFARAHPAGRSIGPLGRLWTFGLRPVLPATPRWVTRVRQRVGKSGAIGEAWGTQDLPKRLAGDVRRRLRQCRPTNWSSARSDEVMHRRGMATGAVEELLRFLDAWSARAGIEHRSPFFDRRFVEFCLSVPSRHRNRNGLTRYFFRGAMADRLPRQILERLEKSNFNEPLLAMIEAHKPPVVEMAIDEEVQEMATWLGLPGAERSPFGSIRLTILRQGMSWLRSGGAPASKLGRPRQGPDGWPDMPPQWGLNPEQAPVSSAVEYWDGLARAWPGNDVCGAQWGEHGADRLEAMIRDHKASGRVLEIGCGAGRFTRRLAGLFSDVEACDLSEAMLTMARKNVTAPNVHFSQADATALTHLRDGTFDAVAALAVFPMMEDFATHWALREVRRVLRPGGLAFLDFGSLRGDMARFLQLSNEYHAKHRLPLVRLHLRTPDQVAWLAMAAGLELIKAAQGETITVALRRPL